MSEVSIYRVPLVMADRRVLKNITNNLPKNNTKGKFSPGLYFCVLILNKDFNFLVKEYDFIKNGKPILNSEKFNFSISYTDDCVYIAIVKNDAVGIDVEKIADISLSVAEEFMSTKELLKLKKVENKYAYFYKIWTLKESYLKLTGEGINDRIKNIEFLESKSDAFSLCLDLEQEIYFNNFTFKNCSISVASYISLNYKIIDFENIKKFLEKYENQYT
ncbi:MAG: 4'-phosphopantetheinyl transferase superfamily protein [Patescibacteria group bacterium]|nr:4'-phosphopantetheinyl transferase superfamily protein [Patescibacteria group bacterium]